MSKVQHRVSVKQLVRYLAGGPGPGTSDTTFVLVILALLSPEGCSNPLGIDPRHRISQALQGLRRKAPLPSGQARGDIRPGDKLLRMQF